MDASSQFVVLQKKSSGGESELGGLLVDECECGVVVVGDDTVEDGVLDGFLERSYGP